MIPSKTVLSLPYSYFWFWVLEVWIRFLKVDCFNGVFDNWLFENRNVKKKFIQGSENLDGNFKRLHIFHEIKNQKFLWNLWGYKVDICDVKSESWNIINFQTDSLSFREYFLKYWEHCLCRKIRKIKRNAKFIKKKVKIEESLKPPSLLCSDFRVNQCKFCTYR